MHCVPCYAGVRDVNVAYIRRFSRIFWHSAAESKYMPGTMAEADPRGQNGSNSPTSLIVDGVLVQPRMYFHKFSSVNFT